MSPSSRKIVIVGSAGTGLLVAIPTILTWLANIGVRKIPGYRGRVKRVRIDFSTPGLVVRGISLAKFNGNKPAQILDVDSVIVASRWKNILAGTIDGYIRIESPRLLLDLAEMHRQAGDATPSGNYRQPWQERVNELPAFRLSSALLADGEIHLRNIPGQNGADVRIDRLNLSVRNVTNSINIAPSLMATLSCKARVMSNGSLELRADGYPFALLPNVQRGFPDQQHRFERGWFSHRKEHRVRCATRLRQSLPGGGRRRRPDSRLCKTHFRSP